MIPAPEAPARAALVEFGPGWGNLARDLVATGLDVTVELDKKFCRLISHRCDGPGQVTVAQGDMLGFATEQPFDAAVFFESFLHCANHLAMLRRLLRDIVRPDGVVLFASEPVQNLDYPWGPRLDGLSVWSSRTYGWLELGFDRAYFDRALARTGWSGRRDRLGPGAGRDRRHRGRGPRRAADPARHPDLTAERRNGGGFRWGRWPRSCVPPAGGRGPPSRGGSPAPGSRRHHRAAR